MGFGMKGDCGDRKQCGPDHGLLWGPVPPILAQSFWFRSESTHFHGMNSSWEGLISSSTRELLPACCVSHVHLPWSPTALGLPVSLALVSSCPYGHSSSGVLGGKAPGA